MSYDQHLGVTDKRCLLTGPLTTPYLFRIKQVDGPVFVLRISIHCHHESHSLSDLNDFLSSKQHKQVSEAPAGF